MSERYIVQKDERARRWMVIDTDPDSYRVIALWQTLKAAKEDAADMNNSPTPERPQSGSEEQER